MLCDAHNHLQDSVLALHIDRISVAWIDLAGPQGRMVVNGTHPGDWARVTELARTHSFILSAFGIHPWDAGAPRPASWLSDLRSYLVASPRASVGEIGLDRWMLDRASPTDPRLAGVRRTPMLEQIATFLPQLALAAELNVATTIHCLDAYDDLLPLLRAYPRPARGFLLHAYSGPAALIPELVALGAYFSFNPAFLKTMPFSPLKNAREAISSDRTLTSDQALKGRMAAFRLVPSDRILCETDAPAMLPPLTWRTHKLPPAEDGSPVNHPGNIEAAYTGLAALRGEAQREIEDQIAANFTRLFGD